ncbi:MAG: bifunctional [glutamate--ammonia ligase]-adenylyl-L-tyrosine phosphorylase/[glutamate--ammonia-ligase] adenylyltransferase [Planctomycetes bacterium]|nr:bifunctional [glutamate--ammonia ligase]-adenylyl-L-tyrosine phosphorylase/[glutamate--ammonia-ligase] adenylyltransferase [Planctomycetota bacterium]
MQIDRLHTLLDSSEEAGAWLAPLGVANTRAAHAALTNLAVSGLPLDLLGTICDQFAEVAPQLADPDMALNSLERFLLAARSPLSMAALFERDPRSLPNLLLMFSSSQNFSDQLCTDPESFDLLRMTQGRPVAREVLVDELVSNVRAMSNQEDVMAALRRFKRRETLRIAYGDIVQGLPVPQVTRQISYVADAVVEAALDFAQRAVTDKRYRRNGHKFARPQFVVLALGKLGGLELNYSSDIDLVFLYRSAEGADPARQTETQDFANRVSQELIRLLTETTALGFAYRVDMRLRPEGRQGPVCSSIGHAIAYYENRGRTWERQAYVKARAIAGDLGLGKEYLAELESWVYRRYLSLADIAGIKALKRRIEDRALDTGVAESDVKAGHGGIRDIEFVIQFLQLLNGGAEPSVRTGNTLEAIGRLEKMGGLTHQERTLLEENYCFLRTLEHRLQIMYDLQTHQLPTGADDLCKVAIRMGFVGTPHISALKAFQANYQHRTKENRKILDHLLHDAFGDDAESEPEVDLVNDPDPDPESIERVLTPYKFKDARAAYGNLMSLAEEPIPFLSTRRCRLFLASIAPRLLTSIARTPDPDATLVTLSRVSDSLGGKAALWELLSSNHPTLNLYVTLCTACPYLSGILTSNPGMIDELLDSLLVGKLPELPVIEKLLAELTHGAEDVEPILHSFKHSQHLRVGVRDILGKDKIEATHAALSDIAEVCLGKIVGDETERLLDKMGEPQIGELADPATSDDLPTWHPGADRVGSRCEFIVLALGKLGSREPNYHSDLDLVFLYEAEGTTCTARRGKNSPTTNNHFFSELGQRVIKRANHFGPYGRLYEVDPRLRPTGRSGALSVSLDEFVRYFQEGGGQLWERLALCKARVVIGSADATSRAEAAITAATYCKLWQASDAAEIRAMRMKLQETASSRNLKRGVGGTMDTEFIVQMLQLKYGKEMPELRVTGTVVGLLALGQAEILQDEDVVFLRDAYRFQRSIEAQIRLMDSSGRHEFPTEEKELAKLAYLAGYGSNDQLSHEVTEMFRRVREIFLYVFDAAEQG